MSAAHPVPAEIGAASPDGGEESLLCPLCEYDLRGLTEPRCPECGYRFAWVELRDRTRRLHPYLFEHHPERNLWSLWRTFLGSRLPWRFWGQLFPTQPSRPKRLLLYGVIVGGACLLPYLVMIGLIVQRWHDINLAQRLPFVRQITPQYRAHLIGQFGSVEAALDATFPLFPDRRLLRQAVRFNAFLLPAFLTIAWPVLTFAGLMVFQASMRRARVRPVHVLRCVIYSADAVFWLASGVAVLAVISLFDDNPLGLARRMDVDLLAPLAAAVMLLLLTARLCVAYRKYLRFDHALATVVASQLMFTLLLLKFALDWEMIR